MEIITRHGPSFAAARCSLAGGESLRVEAGAMMATSDGVGVEAKMEGGLLKSLKRATVGGESFFITTFTAPDEGGWVDVAANLPGDLISREVTPDRPLNIQRGSFVSCEQGVEIDTKWGGFKNLLGGEGGFLVHASGDGTVILGCYGALDTIRLADGERLTLDTGHMVAYDATVSVSLRRAVSGRSMQSLMSGEGFVFDFTGPGEVLTQTRNPNALVQWLIAQMPGQRQ